MKKTPKIQDIIANKNWKFLVKNSLPVNIADAYSFSEAMHIVHDLIEASTEEIETDSVMTDLMRDYCVNLMTILRTKHANEWKEDWKNEAFLGIICSFVYRDDECFKYIKNAFEGLKDPPQSLILAYISAGTRGPDYHLTREEIIDLSNRAISKGVTYEAALQMAFLAQEDGDQKKHEYWAQKALETEKNGIRTKIIKPNVLKDTLEQKNGYQYEK